ncbi:transmembrane protein, putative, partial [Rhizoctonia solani AG-3 Rhs1AP]
MKFKFLLVLFWILALMFHIGVDHQHMLSLPDTITAPDAVPHSVVVLESVLSVLPSAPTPMPRYSLVIPIYHASPVRQRKSSHFSLGERISTIYKWVNAFHARITDIPDRPHPSRTSHALTRVFVPARPAPPVPSHHILADMPVYSLPGSPIDLAGLWNMYKLVIDWIVITCLFTVLTLPRFLSRDQAATDLATSDLTSLPEPSLPAFEYILDIYCALGFPDTEDSTLPIATDESFKLTTSTSSALIYAASALPAWIDTKTGVEGSTEMNSTSVGGKTLESAVPNDSIGSAIEHYVGESSWITPSSSRSLIAPIPDLLTRSPATDQVYSPRRKLWLEGMVTHLLKMQKEGNYLERLYEKWVEGLMLDEPVPGTPGSSDSIAFTENAALPPPTLDISRHGAIPLTPTLASFESDLNLAAEHILSAPSAVAGMSTTVSQDSLYNQPASWLNTSYLGDDEGSEEGQAGTEAGGDDSYLSPSDHPTNDSLPPSRCTESVSTIAKGIALEINDLLSMWR